MLKALGDRIVPHLIIGHHFGEIRGEWRALKMVSRVGVETLVLVLKSLSGPAAEPMAIPDPEEACRLAAAARILNPSLPIRMGCIRPAHPVKARGWKKGLSTRASIPSPIPSRDDRLRP